ncbi:MAG: hypothetical protein AAF311_08375 [Pseudomonadota bacterium]
MTDQTTAHSLAADSTRDTVPVPANPTDAELKSSLEDAEFPRASHMAKEIFGESPKVAEEEE